MRWTVDGVDFCPGQTFDGGDCDAQLLMSVQLSCASHVSSDTWGHLKGLFR